MALILCALLRSSAQHASPVSTEAAEIISEQFATGKVCAMCHSSTSSAKALRDANNRAIGPHDLWKSTMMAHSTADPLWRAVVAAEVAATPSRKAEIETKRLRCHSPMASVEAPLTDTAPSREEFSWRATQHSPSSRRMVCLVRFVTSSLLTNWVWTSRLAGTSRSVHNTSCTVPTQDRSRCPCIGTPGTRRPRVNTSAVGSRVPPVTIY